MFRILFFSIFLLFSQFVMAQKSEDELLNVVEEEEEKLTVDEMKKRKLVEAEKKKKASMKLEEDEKKEKKLTVEEIRENKLVEVEKKTKSYVDRLREHPAISAYYFKGSFLIYDCNDRHFACVDDYSWDRCRTKRDEARQKHKYLLPCAPLKKFTNEIDCTQTHYKMIYNKVNKSFCVNVRKTEN